MEKERGSKVIAIIALCVGILGLSLGFAAFSSNLVIKPGATVTPSNSSFSVVFTDQSEGVVTAVEGVDTVGAFAATPTIGTSKTNNSSNEEVDASTISGLTATFAKPGQKVTYNFKISNVGKYNAYLNSVLFGTRMDANSQPVFKVCTASTGTNQELVNSACNDISLKLYVGNVEYTSLNGVNINNVEALGSGNSVDVRVEIEYVLKGTAAAPTNVLADGDFTIAFGDIQIEYGSVD